MTRHTPPTAPTGAATRADGAPVQHGCVRCGKPVAVDVALCEDCNPLGLADPAASQVHGTAFLGIAIAVIIMAVVARLAVSGVGPFTADVVSIATRGEGLAVTLKVTNQGTSTGSTTCVLNDPAARFGGASGYVQSPRIEPGKTVEFTREITQLGSEPRLLSVLCSNP
jgi:hypothetical protein